MNKTTVKVSDWIDALESGSYGQTQGKLYNGHNYCCLGVLCRVGGATFRNINKDVIFIDDEGLEAPTAGALDGLTAHDLDNALRKFKTKKAFSITPEKSGIKITYKLDEKGRVWSDNSVSLQGLFIELNDDHGATFKEIASVAKNLLRPSAKIRVWTK